MYMAKQALDFVMDILETVVFIGSIFIAVYLFILQPNQVKGASMDPTFASGDYIFTSKITYKFRTPQRGDVVVFKAPTNPDIEYIKRIIGLPGDKIMIKNDETYLNDKKLTETYISAKNGTGENGFMKEGETITVQPDEVFVMGDNRPHSSDSRAFGPIRTSAIIGYVFYRYFPPPKVGVIVNPLPSDLHTLSPPYSLFVKNF